MNVDFLNNSIIRLANGVYKNKYTKSLIIIDLFHLNNYVKPLL